MSFVLCGNGEGMLKWMGERMDGWVDGIFMGWILVEFVSTGSWQEGERWVGDQI